MAACHHGQEKPKKLMRQNGNYTIIGMACKLACASFILAIGCGQTKTGNPTGEIKESNLSPNIGLETNNVPAWFREVTDSSGINHIYHNGEESNHLTILESLGGGVGVIDIDNDGLQDLILAGGGRFDGTKIIGEPCRVYHNEGNWKFKEMSDAIKLDGPWFYNHGIAVTDYDGDGYQDAVITGWGRVALLHSEATNSLMKGSARHLVDVTKKSGISVPTWSTSAAWGDIDGDGLSDLYVCCYVDWSFNNHPHCSYAAKVPDLCPPKEFKGLTNHLFKNIGKGKFRDISKEVRLEEGSNESSKTLGVIISDLDGDGKPDIYTCNDTVENLLYRNKTESGTIKLQPWSRESGCARDDRGNPNGSMGVDVADYDHSGRPSIWVTNYENEPHALYHNDLRNGNLMFSWKTTGSGIAALGQRNVSWGTGFGDLDRDGYEDIFIVNGHAIRYPGGFEKNQKMRPVLLRNSGDGKFHQATQLGGSFFNSQHRSRGAVLVDLNNSGSLDLVVSNVNEPVAILQGLTPPDTHWVGICLQRHDNLDIVGTTVRLNCNGSIQTRVTKGGGSYASSPDRRLHFGIGTKSTIDHVDVAWPDGKFERFAVNTIDRYHTIMYGTGQRLDKTGK